MVHKPDGASEYEVMYTLDAGGNAKAIELMLQVPQMDRNEPTGFEVYVSGISTGTDLVVSEMSTSELSTTDSKYNNELVVPNIPGMVFKWRNVDNNIIRCQLTSPGTQWISVGSNTPTSAPTMVGAFVVLGQVDEISLVELVTTAPPSFAPSPMQANGIYNASFSQENGETVLAFDLVQSESENLVLLPPKTSRRALEEETTRLVFARGAENAFVYHQARASVEINLFEPVVTPTYLSPTSMPTTANPTTSPQVSDKSEVVLQNGLTQKQDTQNTLILGLTIGIAGGVAVLLVLGNFFDLV